MRLKTAFIAGVLALAAASEARADAIADGVAAIPGVVEETSVGGNWEGDGKNGVYRLVIARSGGDSVTARLFVQWIAYTDDGGATVEHSIEIKELADLHVDIANYNSEADADGLSVYLETIDPNGKGDQSYELFVLSPTEYRFGPASN